jgi:hypothetical protein
MSVTELRDHIRLMLTPNAKFDVAAIDRMGGAKWSRAALASTFLLAVDRRFPSPPSREEIAALVARVCEKYITDDALPPMLGEALVRASFGEESLLDGISDTDLTRGQTMMTYGIVLGDLGLRGEAYEEFLTEAANAAQEYLNETQANET